MQFQHKIAIVTGGTHGIGAETAVQLAQQGTGIALIARNSGDGELQKKSKRSAFPA